MSKFFKYISKKRRVKDNLHSLTDTEGNIMTKDEEKAAFFPSVLNVK